MCIRDRSGYDPFSRTLTLTANMAQGADVYKRQPLGIVDRRVDPTLI